MIRNGAMFGWLLCVFLILAGCSTDMSQFTTQQMESPPLKETVAPEQQEPDENRMDVEKQLEEAPAAPETIKEIVTYPAGEFSGMDFQSNADLIMDKLSQYPALQDSSTTEEWDSFYNVLYSYFAELYRSPADILANWGDISFGSPDMDDSRYQYKENFNVEIILDASGSMRAKMDNQTKMDVAKSVIADFVQKLPRGANVGLRVYGHKGSGSDADKELSCGTSELAYGIAPFNQTQFTSSLNQFEPAGWTSIALALNAAQADLKEFEAEKNTNIIFLVSDGIETCDGDPVAAAKSIADSNIEPLLHVIGFDVDSEGQRQLAEVAQAARGTYHDARNQSELQIEMNKTQGMAAEWEEWKLEASEKANLAHSARMMEVLHITNDWSYANADQMKNVGHALEALKSSDQISEDAFHYLYKRMNEHFNSVNEMLDQFNWQLMRMNDKKYREMLREINRRFEMNTQDSNEDKKKKREPDEKDIWW